MSTTIRAALLAGLATAALALPAAAAPSVFDSTAPTGARSRDAAAPLTQMAARVKKKKMRAAGTGGELPREKTAKKKPFSSRPGTTQ